MTSFYSENELKKLGFCEVGYDVKVSRLACFYSIDKISIGNNVRIDDFCVLSGKIEIGNNIHISAYSGLFSGDAGIYIEDYCTISSRCCIYGVNDDYSGEHMTNPTVKLEYRNVTEEKVIIKKHSIIGSGCTVLPGVVIEEGVAVGAMSLVKDNLNEWGIYVGVPCKKIKNRSKNMLRFID